MREIEVKLKVRNKALLEQKLKELGCILSAPIHQHDVIYSLNSSDEEFVSSKAGDVIVRIRHMDKMTQLNLKKQLSYEMDNLEYETEISDPEATHNILTTLGYLPIIEVTKDRRKGELGDYEICLDSVEGLGEFVELEKLTDDDANPEVVRNELFDTLESLGLSRKDEETKGYDTQLYLIQKAK